MSDNGLNEEEAIADNNGIEAIVDNNEVEVVVEEAEPVSAVTVAEDENVTETIIEKSSSNGISKSKSPFMEREEPELIKRWKEENKLKLAEKDAQEDKMKNELKKQAEKDLQEWYNKYDADLGKRKSENRDNQEKFLLESSNLVPGTEWRRINEMCDFKVRNISAGSAAQNRDLSRMKSILLKLKQNPKPIDY